MDQSVSSQTGAAATYVHPAVLCLLLLGGVLILLLPRKYVVIPLLSAGLLLPMDQIVMVGPLHFYLLRLLLAFAVIRALASKFSSRGDRRSRKMTAMDAIVILLGFSGAINYVILSGSWGAVVNQLGILYTMFGGYFVIRFSIRSESDVVRTIRALAYIEVVIAVLMLLEYSTGRNAYVVLGGGRQMARENLVERNSHFRAMAAFNSPIRAGTLGGTSLALFLALWWKGKNDRLVALVGCCAATAITVASASSTPLTAYLAGVGALFLWPLRRHMRFVRWGIASALVFLHIVMRAPVWALIQRIDLTGGSGHHRYLLVDNFIRRFGEWWMIGTNKNAEWGMSMWDLANQYVFVGVSYGLLPFILFLAIITFGFKYVGAARKVTNSRNQQRFLWALGAALFSHVVAFLGISYMDQIVLSWYTLLAVICAATAPLLPQGPPVAHSINPQSDTDVRAGQSERLDGCDLLV